MEFSLHRLAGLLLSVLLLAACDGPAAPENDIVKPAAPAAEWDAHIVEYPKHWVAAEEPLWIRFSHPVAAEDMLNRPLEGLVSVKPDVPVVATFTALDELRIAPVERLPNDQALNFSLHAGKLQNVDTKLTPFNFTVHSIRQDFDLKLGSLAVQDDSDNLMRLSGELHTADTAKLEHVKQLLRVTANGEPAEVSWSQAQDRKLNRFVVENIARDSEAGVVRVAWDGASLGSDSKGARDLVLPARATFMVTGVRVVHHPETYIEVNFSGQLNRRQHLAGLVTVNHKDPKLQVDGSALRVYPPELSEEAATAPVELSVSNLVQNSLGRPLAEAFSEQLVLAMVQPKVNFIGNDASILPPAAQLTVPFEAAGVDSVQVVAFKVFENNIGQYLQRNRLSASYPDQSAGRYLWRKVYRLPDIPRNGSDRFNLDLTELMAQHPDGLLRVELRIDRSNSVFACPGDRPADPVTAEPENSEGEDYAREQAPPWYREYYQSSGYYTYSERNNPCHDAYYYYGNNHTTARTFIVSNIGLLAKRGSDNRLLVVATGLNDAKPLPDAVVKVFNFQQQLIGEGATDAYGMTEIATDGTPFYLFAEHKKSRGYLRLPRNEALPTNQFDVSGEHVKAGLKGFIYGERDVWRPGDDIYLTFILEDKDARIPAGHPVTLDLFDPRSNKQASLTQVQPVGDFYSFALKTDEDAPTGNWRAVVHVGSHFFDKIIKVETVTPNRLKVELTPAATPLRADELPVTVELFSQWLHGASAGGLKADTEVKLFSRTTQFAGYQPFNFDDPARKFEASGQKVFEGKLNADGKAIFPLNLSVETPPPGMLTALFNTRVFEESGNFSTALRAFEFHPFNYWVGLQVPKGDGYSDAISREQDHPVHFQALDRAGKPAPGRALDITVHAIGWRWWWDESGDDLASYVGGQAHSAVASGRVTTDAQGRASWTLAKDTYDWGRHLIRVCDVAGTHCAGQVVYLGWNWSAQKNPESATQLMLTTDQENYRVGDIARVRLPQAAQGRMLLSLENGSRILERRWVDLAKGETELAIPITATMAPNIYVHPTLLLPHQQRESDAPMRLYGIVPLLVEDPATRLQPQLQMPEKVRPETEFSISVSEQDGRAMTYTLAIVDEGLLGLTGFTVPDAHQYFYHREALGVSTWDLFDQVVGAYGATLERILAIGGSDAAQDAERKRRERRFPPVVKFLGAFTLKAGETRAHPVTLPPYMGAVRVMLVAGHSNAQASDAKPGDTKLTNAKAADTKQAASYAYGKVEQTVTVTQPLVLLATLPRVVGPGEEVVLPVNVFVGEASIKDVEISVEANEVFTVVEPSATLHFEQPGDAIASLRLKVNDTIGKGRVNISARSGAEVALQEIYIDSRPANPPSVVQQSKLLAPGEIWQSTLALHGMAGTNTSTLEVSTLPPLNLERRLEYLLGYPHGCLEQTTSAAFPQLHLGKLIELDAEQKAAVDNHIESAIKKLRSLQQANGGFSYWPGDAFINDWASSYAGHFLLEARRAGYAVPGALVDGWVNYQRELARNGGTQGGAETMVAAYRLYTLALADSAELPAMNRLREQLGADVRQPATARWLLAMAYQQLGLKDAASDVIGTVNASLATAIPNYTDQGYTYGSALRDRSLLLLTLTRSGKAQEELAWQLAEQIAGELASEAWYSTQSTAWALLAMSEFAATFGAGTDPMQFSLREENEKNNAAWQTLQSSRSLHRQSLANGSIALRNDGTHPLRALVSNRGTPASLAEEAGANGLQLAINFLGLDNKPLDVQRLPQGSDFVAEITVSGDFSQLPANRLEDIALTMVMPSGWQIRNERLEESQEPKGIDYLDIRDDRVLAYFSLWQNYHWSYRYQDRNQPSVTLRVVLNASYAGKFYLPGWHVSAMYDERVQARSTGYWVEVF